MIRGSGFVTIYKLGSGLVGLIAAVIVSGQARAATTAYDLLDQFNAVVFGDFTNSADVEGRAIVGGNLTGGASFYVKPSAQDGATSLAALNVYGNATAAKTYNFNNGGAAFIAGGNHASFNMNGGGSLTIGGNNTGNANMNGGNLYLGGNSSGSVNLNSGAHAYMTASATNSGTISPSSAVIKSYTYTDTLPDLVSQIETPLKSLSAQLSAATANSAFPTIASLQGNFNNVQINATPNAAGVAVFTVSAAVLSQFASFQVNPNGASSVIFNVDCGSKACSYTDNANQQFGGTSLAQLAPSLIWNFYNAGSVTMNGELAGTVLAPYATVNNHAPIDGTLVAASYNGNGELHDYPFRGTRVAAPEPGGLAILGVALVGLIGTRRRRVSAG
jgi:choice-of-anchor A domain-containing protein